MGRAQLIIASASDRRKASEWIAKAPWNTRVTFNGPKRSVPQNDLMWSRLTEISQTVVWYGQKLSPDDWKDVFTASLRKARVVPGLDAGSFVPLGKRPCGIIVCDRLGQADDQPPVTLICRDSAGRCWRRSITKSWPLGLRVMASSIAA